MTVQPHYSLRDQQPEMGCSSTSEKHGGHQPLTATLLTCRQYLIDTFGYDNMKKLLQATKFGLKNLPKDLYKACKFIIKVLSMPETWLTVAVVATANSIVFSIPAIIMENKTFLNVNFLSSSFGSIILVRAMYCLNEKYSRQDIFKGSWITSNIITAVITSNLLHTTLLLFYSISVNDGSAVAREIVGLRSVNAFISIGSWLIITFFLCPH